jgi:hypothetical protein
MSADQTTPDGHGGAYLTSCGRRRRVIFALALVASCGQPLPGFAKDAWWKGCFRGVYDPAHLAVHPGQTVKSIAVRVTPMTGNGSWIANAELTVTLGGRKMKYYVGGDCQVNATGLDCSMDCDAGGFSLAPRAAGVKLVVGTTGGGIRLSRAGQDSEESKGPFLRTNNSENRTFLLPPAPAAACK